MRRASRKPPKPIPIQEVRYLLFAQSIGHDAHGSDARVPVFVLTHHRQSEHVDELTASWAALRLLVVAQQD